MPTKQRRSAEPPAAIRREPGSRKILEVLEQRSALLAAALVLLASARIIATYTVFNHTADEPAHVACGMEWLDQGVYRWEAQHPPLARVAAALGPYLLGVRSQGTARDISFAMFREGPQSSLMATVMTLRWRWRAPEFCHSSGWPVW